MTTRTPAPGRTKQKTPRTAPARQRGRPPRRHHDDGPEAPARVLDAAIALFATHGFHGTSVAQIGAVAGLGAGALYYHMGSKEELLWLVLRRHVEEALSQAEAIAASPRPPAEQLRELIHSHVRVIAHRRDEVKIYIRDADALTGERARQLQALRDTVQATWQRVLSPGRASGEFRSDDHVLANGLLGMMNSLWIWYRPGGPHSPDAIADEFCAMVLDGLSPR